MDYKTIFGFLSMVLTFVAFYPYIHSIFLNITKPHIFSWLIWGISTILVFLAQFKDSGAAGAIPIGVSGIITLYIAWLSYVKRTDLSIHKIDWVFLISALLSVPVWYITSNPLWAVVILTTIDTLGFGPTVRKAYEDPFKEDILFYALFVVRNLLMIVAMEQYSLTTMLFPIVTGLGCLLLIALIIYRRNKLKSV